MTTGKNSGSTTKGAPKAQKNAIDLKVDDLTEKINYFKVKNELLKKKRRFDNTQKDLIAALEKIDNSNDFDFTNEDEIKFKIIQDYNTEICSISNPFVIGEILNAVLSKIDEKLISIDSEILA